jgi:hypothetical protein
VYVLHDDGFRLSRVLPERTPLASVADTLTVAVRVCAVMVHNRRAFADVWELFG